MLETELQEIKNELELSDDNQEKDENEQIIEEINESSEVKKDYSSFDNYTKKRITLIGYLLGIRDEVLEKVPFDQKYLETIKDVKDLKIIRSLCRLRLNFMTSYEKIYHEKSMNGPFAQFSNMNRYIDVQALKYLESQNLMPLETGVQMREFTKHIANINQLIEENIDSIHSYIPEWIEWNYIKNLFIMPGCSSGINGCNYSTQSKGDKISNSIHSLRKDFLEHIEFYPFGAYLNWNRKKRFDDEGNILFNDCKFLTLLYDSYYDTFKGSQYVIDAKDTVKNSIYEFIEQAENVALFVDCENIDPYNLAAALKNLDSEKISKIRKIVLYDDINTTNAWDILQDVLNLNVEHVEVERIKDDKSLVDHALSIGVTKSFYEERTESVVIVSSDSDFWSLIRYLPNIRFFVMNETETTSEAVLNKLDDYGIPHCFIDEFAQDAIQPYKNIVLQKNLNNMLDMFNMTGIIDSIDIEEILDELFRKAAISVPYKQLEKEKEDFYTKYLKKLKLTIVEDDEGNRKFKLIIGK